MAAALKPLRRHQLVWLDEFAWYRVLTASLPADGADRALPILRGDCLAHWAQHRLPLVVTRQPDEVHTASPDAALALGLAAPARWGHQAIGLRVGRQGVARQGEFPAAADLLGSLPAAARPGWARLCEQLARLGAQARVYGSYGWQHLTGLDHVHAGSDVDLAIEVSDAAQADQVCARLQAADTEALRLDGELAFGNGASVAWREWRRFRAGLTQQILVKRIAQTTLEDPASWAAHA
jgi:phosphoribosyl-dephospho-CoA transferase